MKDFGFDELEANHLLGLLARLAAAGGLGALLAFRCWRPLMRGVTPPSAETAQAQTLIAVAGALMVSVIGESTARAFGLVGLGAFIRFRAGIKDRRDAAVMFVMIGIGMACGLGSLWLACAATLMVGGVLAVFEASERPAPRRARIRLGIGNLQAVLPAIDELFPGVRVLELDHGREGGELLIEVELPQGGDAASVLGTLVAREVAGVRTVALDEAKAA